MESDQNQSTNARRKRILLIGSALVLCLIAWITAPVWRTYSEQDDCTFGPVSNAEYRALLARAQQARQTRWAPFDNSGNVISAELRSTLDEMTRHEPSLYRRVATIHAIARANGARFLNFNEGGVWPAYEAGPNNRNWISFNYEADISRFIRLQPYPRQVWIPVTVSDLTHAAPNLPLGDGLAIAMHALWLADRPNEAFLTDAGRSCPPIPNVEIAARYEARRK